MTALLPTRYRVIGSGPVALACALFMVRGGIDPRRVHLSLAPAGANPAPADGRPGNSSESGNSLRRMLALSDGSRQLLSRIIGMPAGGVIECIEVALSGRSGRARIRARDFDVAALGHVIAYPELVTALRAATDRMPFATVESSITLRAVPEQEVAIHADGMPRPSSETSVGFGARAVMSRDFNQAALLTEVMAEYGGTTAYECFGEHGPLALLPAAPAHSPRYAVVWCDRPEASAARAALSPASLSAVLNEALGAFAAPKKGLGTLRVCAPVQTAPLSRLRRIHGACGREVWIGNAAQALHPVAGQGLNLGLRDAFELARSLADNEYANQPLAPEEVLARFAASRRIDRSITTGVTDLLAATFTWPLARPLQSALLTAMDLLPPVRRPLASTLLFGRR
ncbi:MAG: FAD-dependent monooxygenase [Lautropia sp.]|nr:FAD-dependent monooxygenase [Lautropia sp.]